MDIRKVKKLIELLEESGIAEIEITEGEEAVRISRYPQGGAIAMPPPIVAPAGAGSGSRTCCAVCGTRRGGSPRRGAGCQRQERHRPDGRLVLPFAVAGSGAFRETR